MLALLVTVGAVGGFVGGLGSGLGAVSSFAPVPHVNSLSTLHVRGKIMPTLAGSSSAIAGSTSTWCLGLYPTTNISYVPGCYGHDEPTISYMSNAAHSGTDASWWQVLPSNGASLEQGDMYATFWYGGTVSDSASLNGVAFLEWQFYPLAPASTGAGSGTNDCQTGGSFNGNYPSNNLWFSCVIVWEVVGGVEQAAYAGPMDYAGGSNAIMEMNSGDMLYVNYSGSTTGSGWQLSVHDLKTGQFGTVVMAGGGSVDPRGTLNPASDVATWCELSWGASCPGEIAWAYEIGHTLNPSSPDASNCPPGDGVCPSYNPADWASVGNQQLSLPVLGAPGAREYPLRFGFSSSQGGYAEINAATGCPGANNCVYPWYIYSSNQYGFNYQGQAVTNNTYDFGNVNQYSQTSSTHTDWLPPYANVTFVVNRNTAVISASPGPINQTGGAYTSGNLSTEFAEGQYTITANAPGCVAYSQSWYFKAGTPYTIDINLVCGGAITTVNFYTTPTTCPVNFNAVGYTNAQSTVVSAGSYPVSLGTCPGYTGGTIQGSGAVSVVGGTATTVAGTGNVYANYSLTNPTYAVSFSVTPSGVGNGILFNGTTFYNGQSSAFTAGSYAVLPSPSPGYRFTGWTASGGVSSPAGGTVTVSAAGALSATYIATAKVAFAINPATTCAAQTTFNLTAFSNGQQGTFASGGATYPVSAGTCPGYQFSSWTSTGGVSLSSTTSATATATLTGNGTLTANFAALPYYTVTFSVSSVCSITWSGSAYVSGGSVQVHPGTYPVAATACQYYAFSSWTGTASAVSVASPTSASTNVTVSANGTLTATYVQTAFPVHLVVQPTSCVGVQVKIGSSTLTNGQTAYLGSGSYLVTAGSCTGQAPTPVFQVTSGTGLTYASGSLSVSGGGGTFAVTYVSVLSATLTGPSSVTSGSPATFIVSLTGGKAPYALGWRMGDGGATIQGLVPTGATSGNTSYTYTRPGTYTVTAIVNDSDGQTAIAHTTITVTAQSSGSGGLLGLFSNPLVLLLILVVLVAIVAAVVLSRRKKKGTLPSENDYYPAPGSGYPGYTEPAPSAPTGNPGSPPPS